MSNLGKPFCESCSKLLTRLPQIILESHNYCFACAKREAGMIFQAHLKAVDQYNKKSREKYEQELAHYDKTNQPILELHRELCGKIETMYWDYRGPRDKEKYEIRRRIEICIPITIWLILPAPITIPMMIIDYYRIKVLEAEIEEFIAAHPKPPQPPLIGKAPTLIIRSYSAENKLLGTLSLDENCNREDYIKRGYDRADILRRDGRKCQCCGQEKGPSELEIHHVLPRAEGGSDYERNLITLCRDCHEAEDWFGHVHIRTLRQNQFDSRDRANPFSPLTATPKPKISLNEDSILEKGDDPF